MITRAIVVLVIVLSIAALCWGPIVSNVEQAQYTVIEKQDTIEIRDYSPMLVAEVKVAGEREAAIKQGFRMIADFIFGNNVAAEKVAMTAPVIQQKAIEQKSEPIAMTAPVMQNGSGDQWDVRFVMPAHYTLATLPKPKNSAVKISEVPGKRFAVIRFSGFSTQDNIEKNTETLNAFLLAKKLKTSAPMTYAFFNPPWTLPFMRRNEIMAEIEK